MKIKACAGIGDNIWLIQKLLSTGQKFDFELANDTPRRGEQIFRMIPSLVNSISYGNFYSGQVIDRYNRKPYTTFKEIQEDEIFLSCNTHLESGKRLETFLCDLDTVWFPEWELLDCGKPDQKVIGIYASCYSVLRHWNFWKEDQWLRLISTIHSNHPKYIFSIIGAEFDTDLGHGISRELTKHGIPHEMRIGTPLGEVADLMNNMQFMYSFPSGMGILSHSVACPTMMFYPPHLKDMKQSWISPIAMHSKWFFEEDFITPDEAYEKTKHML